MIRAVCKDAGITLGTALAGNPEAVNPADLIQGRVAFWMGVVIEE